ncbi:SDR family oxidoreductase [Candidatus Acetothermia bacterium]|nr:SDR family oxidoreductase [Candidatus Acetothermia bacterium]
MSKTLLITGASSGIGRATALLFQKQGWNVAATMRSPEKETELSKLPNVLCARLDVTNLSSIPKAIDDTLAHFKSVDVVVNNAGYALIGPFEASTPEQIERQFATNLFGVTEVTRAILPYFRETKNGTIINVTSMGGRITFPFYSLYHATKWATEGFSESLLFELKPLGIRVKLVEPGPIRTDFYRRSMVIMNKPELKAYDELITRAMPNMQESGVKGASPEAVAKVIYRAATDNSWRLRYPVGSTAGLLLFLRRILPDRAFNGIIRRAVFR